MAVAAEALRVFGFMGRPDGCSFWRLASPMNALRASGYPCRYGKLGDAAAVEAALQAQLVVFPRIGWMGVLRSDKPQGATFEDGRVMLAKMHQAGQLAIQDMDDDVWVSRGEQKDHVQLGFGYVPEATPGENQVSTKMYDGITVSEPRLKTIIESFAPDLPCEVVPNAIDLDYWEACLGLGWSADPPPGFEGKVIIGWAGGNRWDTDLEIMAEGWRRTAAKCPNAAFAVMGHCPDVLTKAVPANRLITMAWMAIEPTDNKPPYPCGLATFDVSCCSVAANRFNSAKSAIKWMESTASGAAVVGTEWVYGRVIRHGENGLIANTADEWESALVKLVRDRKLRRRLQRRAMRDLRERYSLEVNKWRWPVAWANIAEAAGERLRARSMILVPGWNA